MSGDVCEVCKCPLRESIDLDGLRERACKADGMANEVNILTAENRALTSELAEARAERDSLAETRAALTANLNALTVDVATMRAERDEARRALAEMWSAAWLLMWRAIGDSISADDWCNEWARCPSPEAFAEVTRERDALLDMARDISVYAATSARHGSERSMRDVLTMTANRARSFLLPKSAHGAGEAK